MCKFLLRRGCPYVNSLIAYNLGKIILEPRNSHEQRTKGIVKAGSPYGKSHVLMALL